MVLSPIPFSMKSLRRHRSALRAAGICWAKCARGAADTHEPGSAAAYGIEAVIAQPACPFRSIQADESRANGSAEDAVLGIPVLFPDHTQSCEIGTYQRVLAVAGLPQGTFRPDHDAV